MTADQAFKKIVAEITKEVGMDPDEEDLVMARQIFDAGSNWAMDRVETSFKTDPPPPDEL